MRNIQHHLRPLPTIELVKLNFCISVSRFKIYFRQNKERDRSWQNKKDEGKKASRGDNSRCYDDPSLKHEKLQIC